MESTPEGRMHRSFGILLAISLLLSGCSRTLSTAAPLLPTPISPTSTKIPYPTATPFVPVYPTVNPEILLFAVHIQVIRVANDDGSELANISPDEVIRMVDAANEIMAQFSVRFLFDPQTDVDILQSTTIASMLTQGDENWQDSMSAADEIAKEHPGKITVFFRKQPVVEPTKDKLIWWDYNFVLFGAEEANPCGKPDETALLHAIGHYLGLGNTNSQSFPDEASAAKAYKEAGYNLSSFDGDGFTDTPADIFVSDDVHRCGNSVEITLDGAIIPITRGNVMSGYLPRTTLTTMQVARFRYLLALRQRIGMVMPSNAGIKDPIEFESLPGLVGWVTTQPIDLTQYSLRNFSGGKGIDVIAGYYSTLNVEFTVDKEGIYDLTFYGYTSPSSGVLEVYVDEYLVNDFIDLYGPYTYATGPVGMSPYYFTPGTHQMIFKVIKKNDLSTGYNFGLDAFTAVMKQQ
jgi:hypothetical protein